VSAKDQPPGKRSAASSIGGAAARRALADAVPAPIKGAGKAAAGRPAALPPPALEDPPAPGLDLAVWRPGPVPRPERDPTPFPNGDFVLEGYSIAFGEGDEVLISDPKGKRLKSVPDKLRKHEDYQALMRGRKDDRARERRARRVLEERMISGAPLSAEEIAWLVEDDAFAPLLSNLIVRTDAKEGLLVAWDAGRGLGLLPLDYDARWVGWQAIELLHPMKLGEVLPWQDLLLDLARQQALVQAFREVRSVPVAQRKLSESLMLGGRETRAASMIERVLIEEGWVARRGTAKRKLQVRSGDRVVAVEAWFDYGEYYLPAEPTTTGAFGFTEVGTGLPKRFNEVPAVLVSEAIRSLEVCLAQAGAAKDTPEGEAEGKVQDAEEAAARTDAPELDAEPGA
jgi:hypothetical protein